MVRFTIACCSTARGASVRPLALVLFMLSLTTTAEAEPIKVLHAVDQRPLDHINHDGLSEAILADYWKLWSKKTGIEIEFEGALFQDCLERARELPNVVLSGIYYSPFHDTHLDLSQRMLSIKSMVFARRDLSLDNLAEAPERPVGVVSGDSAHAFLDRHEPDHALHVFGSSEALVEAAVRGDVDLFALDYPSAVHLLNMHRALHEFDAVQTLFVGRVCAAVGEGNGALLLSLNTGIDQISSRDVNRIFERHLPHPWVLPRWATRFVVLGVLLVLLVGGAVHVLLLKSTVRRSTKELREKNDRLREEVSVRNQVEQALAEQNRRLQDMNQELDRLASTDALTGLNNRRHLMDRLAEEIDRSQRYGNPLSILLLDLDHFKEVNDTHGHLVGDAVLKKTGEIIAECARTTDLPGRYGGEEFAVVLPQTDATGARDLAERLRQKLEAVRHYDENGQPFQVTCSIGVASVNGHFKATALLKHADDALYKAKEEGRNRIKTAQLEELQT